MPRKEYFRDAAAPRPNRLVVAATAFVLDTDGRVLMIERADNQLWALPGGAMEVGEFVAGAAERETLEETGFHVKVVGLVGVYSDPDRVIAYDDGEVRQQFALCFRAELTGGELRTSEETPSVKWVSEDELDALPIHPSTRLRLQHGFANSPTPYIG